MQNKRCAEGEGETGWEADKMEYEPMKCVQQYDKVYKVYLQKQ